LRSGRAQHGRGRDGAGRLALILVAIAVLLRGACAAFLALLAAAVLASAAAAFGLNVTGAQRGQQSKTRGAEGAEDVPPIPDADQGRQRSFETGFVQVRTHEVRFTGGDAPLWCLERATIASRET
jgi:hypothetical protein